MSAAVGFGTYSISNAKLTSISQRANDAKSHASLVERIWDKIMDYFCGTHRDEAKLCLSVWYSPQTTNEQKFEAFVRLKELAGEQYEAKFRTFPGEGVCIYTFITDDPVFTRVLVHDNAASVGDARILEDAVTALDKLRRSDAAQGISEGKFDVDLPTLMVNDEAIVVQDLGDVVKARQANWAQFDEAIRSMCNDAERASIYTLCDWRACKVMRAAALQCDFSGIDAIGSSARAQQFEVMRAWDGRIYCALLSVDEVVDNIPDPLDALIGDDLGWNAGSQRLRFAVCVGSNGDLSLPRPDVLPLFWDPVSWTNLSGEPLSGNDDEWAFDVSGEVQGVTQSSVYGSRLVEPTISSARA
ncbi:MAG TPA: hypothetical protein VL424_21280 [Pararobbsia sp.]|jgi:hypothetical protein|nr:hypothetical protein [Pararobbsia sp.]